MKDFKQRYDKPDGFDNNEKLGRNLFIKFLDNQKKNYLVDFATEEFSRYDATLRIDGKEYMIEIKSIYNNYNQLIIDESKINWLFDHNHNSLLIVFYPNENKVRYIHTSTVILHCKRHEVGCPLTTSGKDNSYVLKSSYIIPYS